MKNSYGVLESMYEEQELHEQLTELKVNGYTVVNSGFSKQKITSIKEAIKESDTIYRDRYQASKSESEQGMIRAPYLSGNRFEFIELALNQPLLELISEAMRSKFVMTQQNVVVNPAGRKYSQGRWHRDIPYQHFVSTRPLAINALFCVDEFTFENGATKVIPGSHLHEAAPNDNFAEDFEKQLTAKPGDFLVLDCMIYHSGAPNLTALDRVGVNHVYAIPFFKKQIDISSSLMPGHRHSLSEDQQFVLGVGQQEPRNLDEYFN